MLCLIMLYICELGVRGVNRDCGASVGMTVEESREVLCICTMIKKKCEKYIFVLFSKLFFHIFVFQVNSRCFCRTTTLIFAP
jgi:hypothetical protein